MSLTTESFPLSLLRVSTANRFSDEATFRWASISIFGLRGLQSSQASWYLEGGKNYITFRLIERDGFLFTLQLRDFIIIIFYSSSGLLVTRTLMIITDFTSFPRSVETFPRSFLFFLMFLMRKFSSSEGEIYGYRSQTPWHIRSDIVCASPSQPINYHQNVA